MQRHRQPAYEKLESGSCVLMHKEPYSSFEPTTMINLTLVANFMFNPELACNTTDVEYTSDRISKIPNAIQKATCWRQFWRRTVDMRRT